MSHYQQLFKLEGKVALVTGGAGILGSAFCHALCDLGASVACVDVNETALQDTVKKLRDQYGEEKVMGFVCDVSSTAEVDHTVNAVLQHFSKIDILLNNAATKSKNPNDFFAPFTQYTLDVWREIMSVNLDGMFLMAQAVGQSMLEKRHGVILQTASIYSFMAPDQRIYEGSDYLGREINTPAVYTTSKAGVIGLTKHLATLWATQGIRVNALCPGGVTSGQNNAFTQKYAARIPMGRMAKEIDIVGPMLFLVSPASSYMTGQVIFADGGLSAW